MTLQNLYIFPSQAIIQQQVTPVSVLTESMKESPLTATDAVAAFKLFKRAVPEAVSRLANKEVSEDEFNRIINSVVGIKRGLFGTSKMQQMPEEKYWGFCRTPLRKMLEKTAQKTYIMELQELNKA